MISSAPSGATEKAEYDPEIDALLTVAICTRNRAHFLKKAVDSVLKQIVSGVEILIVDNGSTDGTEALAGCLEESHPAVRYLHEGQIGLSAARNAALRQARGRYVVFLDDDATADPGWVNAYVSFFSKLPNRRVACAGGPVYPIFESAPPGWWLPTSGILDNGPTRRELVTESGPWGGNIAYERDAALQAGGFNTNLGRKGNFRGAHEECELNQRLKSRGWQIWWLPDAGIKHFTPKQRFSLRLLIDNEVAEGRSAALVRLGNRTAGLARAAYLGIRLIGAPFHCLLNLLTCGILAPFQNGRSAVKFVLRAARIAGFACELFVQLPNAFSASGPVGSPQEGNSSRSPSPANCIKTALPHNEKV